LPPMRFLLHPPRHGVLDAQGRSPALGHAAPMGHGVMIREFDVHGAPRRHGRIAANEFAGMIRPYVLYGILMQSW
jgi:hypothetical protein